MEHSTHRLYGFTYEYGGKRYALDVVADTLGEATGRVASMAGARCVGELREDNEVSKPGE